MAGDAHKFPRTLEDIFSDFKGRRKALISALTTDVEEFFIQCNPARRALCLYGFPNGMWQVSLPVEMVPSNLPEPTLGINIARDEMQEKNWLALVAARSDAWLLSVAFYFGARIYFGKADREHLFNMIHGLPTIFEVVTKKKVKDKSSGTNHSDSKSLSNSKLGVPKDKDEDEDDKYEDEDEDGDGELDEEEEILDLLLHMQKMVL